VDPNSRMYNSSSVVYITRGDINCTLTSPTSSNSISVGEVKNFDLKITFPEAVVSPVGF